MFKKILLAIILIVALSLISPIPFRYGRVFCECVINTTCSCPREGDIGWNQSLIIQLFVSITNYRQNNIRTGQDVIDDKKNNDSCNQNEDCKYIWVTGGCHTPEYVAKIQKEAEAVGRRNGEAPPRENVTCTCESDKCVTHN